MWLIELFRAVEQALGKREIIAEDLGYMSETVRQLVRDSGFPDYSSFLKTFRRLYGITPAEYRSQNRKKV